MMMSLDPRLSDLLLRWEDLRQSGRPCSAEDLCRDCPELLSDLRREIRVLESMEAMLGSAERPSAEPVVPLTFAAGEQPAVLNYDIVRELGRGGMGVVYLAYDRQRGDHVALKTLQRIDPAGLVRFKQEFRALANVVHPNLVSLYELISHGQRWFVVMQFIEGVDFLKHVRSDGAAFQGAATSAGERPNSVGLFSIDEQVGVAAAPPRGLAALQMERLRQALRQLVQGVQALHAAGKLHRDVKPSNVLVTREGRVMLLDFGLAAELDRAGTHLSTDQHLLGTVPYMAPEQAAGSPVSRASDWYSVGVILYEALTGRLPFTGKHLQVLLDKQKMEPPPPRAIVADAPEDLNTLCVDLLRLDAELRPQGHEILSRLENMPAEPALRSTAVPGYQPPFIGRERHLAELHRAFRDSASGRAVSVYVQGRSGMGKSALVQRFLDTVLERGDAVVLSGRCYERESVPYKALDSLIDALSRFLKHLPYPEAAAILPRDVVALAKVFPVLRRLEGLETSRRALEIPDERELRRRAFGALRELFARLADKRPVVLYVDDLQWGDADSAALLTGLMQPPDPPAVLLIAAYRAEDAATSPMLRVLLKPADTIAPVADCRELVVDALSLAEARDLALELLGPDQVGTSFRAESISRESGGSPFYVHELAQFVESGEQPGATGDIALNTVLWSRVERLDAVARRLLEVVAVAGRPLRESDACQAAELNGDDRAALAVLRSGRLIRGARVADQDQIETYHDRVRETVAAHLPESALAEHHARLARVLERSGRTDPEVLAIHFQGAKQFDKAGDYFAEAAERAAETLAFERAVKLFRLALEWRASDDPRRPALQTHLAHALANAGRGAEAGAIYLQAAEAAPPEESLELTRRAALHYCISGHLDEGRSAMRKVLSAIGMRLPEGSTSTLAALVFFRSWLRLRGLRFRQRDKSELSDQERLRLNITESVAMGCSTNAPWHGALFQTRHLLLALAFGEPVQIAVAMSWEASYSSMPGRPTRRRTERLLKRAEDLAVQTQDPHALGSSSLSYGISEFLAGRYQSALGHNQQAEAILRERCTGVTWEQDTAQIFGLWSLFYMGRINDTRACYSTVFKEATDRGDRYLITTLGTQVGTLILLADDQPQHARQTLDEIMSRWTHDGFTVQHHNEFMARQAIDLYAGDLDSALRRLKQVEPRYRPALLLRIQHIRIDLAQLKVRCFLAAAERDPARQAYWLRRVAACIRQLRGEQTPWADVLADFLEANRQLATRSDKALGALHRAAEELREAGLVLLANVADWQRGHLLGGEPGAAIVNAAEEWFRQQEVRNPQRLINSISPLAKS